MDKTHRLKIRRKEPPLWRGQSQSIQEKTVSGRVSTTEEANNFNCVASDGSIMDKAGKSGYSRLFWVVILELVLYVALDVVAQLLLPHYSPISQAESDLAVGKFGFIMTINFLNRGVLSLLFIFAFLQILDSVGVARSRFRTGTYLLGAWAVGAILLAIFPTDVPATPVSWHGAIHLVVAVIAFIGGAFGTLAVSQRLGREFGGLKRITLPLSVIVVLFWVVELGLPFVAPHLNGRIDGLTERLFLGSVLLWIGVLSAYFATNASTKVDVQEK
jgi:hypothetical protein